MTQPAEHCGHQPDPVIGQPTECVLRPGHSGSHADHTGMRWWMRKTEQSTGRPRVDQLTDDMLDQLYAELWHLRLDKEGAGLTLRTVTRRAQEQRERAEKAESELDRLTAMASRYSDRAIENGERADRAEAAIARVRAELAAIEADVHGQHDEDDDGMREAVRRIRAALDGTA